MDDADRVGRYVAGPRDYDKSWLYAWARHFGTRDAAVEHALNLSRQPGFKDVNVFVSDTGRVPYFEIGTARNGKFDWNTSFKKPYT